MFKQLKLTKTIWGLSRKMPYILFCLRILIAFCFTMFWKRKTTSVWWAGQRTTTILTMTQTTNCQTWSFIYVAECLGNYRSSSALETMRNLWNGHIHIFSFTLPIMPLNTPTFMVLLMRIKFTEGLNLACKPKGYKKRSFLLFTAAIKSHLGGAISHLLHLILVFH